MSDTPNPAAPPSPDIDVATACCEVLEPRLEAWLDAADEALYALSEKSGDAEVVAAFLDDLRSMRQHRDGISGRFLDQLDLACYRFTAGQPCAEPRGDAADGELGRALDAVRRHGENRHRQALAKLYRRFADIRGGEPLDHASAPVSPVCLCDAVRSGLAGVPLSERSLVVIGKTLDDQFIAPLDEICEELLVALYRSPPETDEGEQPAEDFIERGVRAASRIFGQVRTLVMRRQHVLDPPPRAAAPVPAPEPDEAAKPEAPGPSSADAGPAPDSPGGASESDDESGSAVEPAPAVRQPAPLDLLLSALTVLQARALEADLDEVTGAGPEALREALLRQVERISEDPEAPVLTADHETALELVAMLFAFIHEADDLPPAIKTRLARLHVPYLKAALIQPEVFARDSHPARRLLDLLAQTGLDHGSQPRVEDKIDEVVQRILADFEDDFALFDQLRQAFQRFTGQLRREEVHEARKAARIEEGRERVRVARTLAAKAIGARTRDADLPPPVRELLRRPWVNAMTLVYLRHGGESGEWQQCLQFVDDLIWSLEPKASAADVARLQSMLPAFSRQLGNGLEDVAMTRDDMRRVFEDLRQVYRGLVDERYRDVLHLPDSYGRRAAAIRQSLLPRPDRPDTSAPRPAGKAAPASDPGAPPSNFEVWLEVVRGLQPGTWFDLRTDSGSVVRAKLSWVNPATHSLLFVDADGLKLSNKSAEDFAGELQSGEATLLENLPLFARAMAAISERLRGERGGQS